MGSIENGRTAIALAPFAFPISNSENMGAVDSTVHFSKIKNASNKMLFDEFYHFTSLFRWKVGFGNRANNKI